MKKLLIVLIISILPGSVLFSQNFMREAGLRGGLTSGYTYRQYLDEYLSYEGIFSFRKAGMQFTLIRQVHEMNPVLDLGTNFNFLYGFGGHVGYYFSDYYKVFGNAEYYYDQKMFSPVVGVDAYAALEYRLDSFPLVVGMDYKPFFEFSMYQFFKLRLWDFAFNIRYRF